MPLLPRLPAVGGVGASSRARGKLPQAGFRGGAAFTSAKMIVDSSESEESSEDEVGGAAERGSDDDTDDGRSGGEGLNKETNTR